MCLFVLASLPDMAVEVFFFHPSSSAWLRFTALRSIFRLQSFILFTCPLRPSPSHHSRALSLALFPFLTLSLFHLFSNYVLLFARRFRSIFQCQFRCVLQASLTLEHWRLRISGAALALPLNRVEMEICHRKQLLFARTPNSPIAPHFMALSHTRVYAAHPYKSIPYLISIQSD